MSIKEKDFREWKFCFNFINNTILVNIEKLLIFINYLKILIPDHTSFGRPIMLLALIYYKIYLRCVC